MTPTSSLLYKAPPLVEIHRGSDGEHHPLIECVHHGIIAVVDGRGETIFAHGPIDYYSHMRSCAKPFQLLPLFDMGFFADDALVRRYDIRAADIALMMSSHAGEPMHTERVKELLANVSLDHHALRCGIHAPYDTTTYCKLMHAHEKPSELHNNCSGKHFAMVMACIQQGFDRHSYEQLEHPLQRWIKRLVATIADYPEHNISSGTDGCSLPSLVMPLRHLALMFARFSYWAKAPHESALPFLPAAFQTMWNAVTTYPEYLAGTKRFDSMLIRLGAPNIFSKGGADGLLAIAVAPSDRFPYGLGIVIKIADGDSKQLIRPLIAKAVLEGFGLWPKDKRLDGFMPPTENFRGLPTGRARLHFSIAP